MERDRDIAASLPEPPPPSLARRAASIEAALRRYDGEPGSSAKGSQASRRPRISRPQIAWAASLLLVAVVGAPIAWKSLDRQPGRSVGEAPVPAPTATRSHPAAGPTTFPVPDAEQPSPEPEPRASAIPVPIPARPGSAPSLPPPPPPAAPAVVVPAPAADARVKSAPAPAEEEEVPMLARRAAAPPASQLADAATESDAGNVVVTGSRIASKANARGEWNACTVNDPARDPRRCRAILADAAPSEPARAALAEGLESAWQGDPQSAVDAFGRAIAAAPRSGFAYLNRGLAWQRLGELDRAQADLDQAVRLGRASPRAYFARSQLLRQRGDRKRAEADQNRAIGLDSRYREVAE